MKPYLSALTAVLTMIAAGCGGDGTNAGASDSSDAYEMIVAEIAALEEVLTDLPPEARTEIEGEIQAEIAALRAEATALASRSSSPRGDGETPAAGLASDSNGGSRAQARQASGSAKGLPDGAWRVKPFKIMDRTGFEKPLVAATILAPADWKDEGGVVWTPNDACNSSGYNYSYKVSSVDGLSNFTVFPTDRWFWSSNGSGMPGCRTETFDSAEAYLRGMIPRVNAAARIVSYRQRDDMLKLLRPYENQTPMPGGGLRTYFDAGEAIIEYQENGVNLREMVAVAITFNESWLDPSYGMPGYKTIGGSTMPGFAYRAPVGEFDAAFAEAVRTSYAAGPEWSRRIARHQAKINKSNLETSRKISDINARTNAEISDMMHQGYRERDAMRDRGARETSEAIRGVETYDDPYAPGGTVELDFTYDNAWRLDDGTYVLTDDVDFQPFRDLGVDGRKLTPTP
ncbi:MAG: hypothetical protein AAF224_02920 [Pseudomonadota bacterium]